MHVERETKLTAPAGFAVPDLLGVKRDLFVPIFAIGRVPGWTVQVMEQLEQFRPYLTGAVLNGTAGEHDDVHLQLFADSAKDVIIFLLDRDVNIEISETPHFKGARHDPVETVSFHWRKQQVHAELYELNDQRGALKPRADGRPQRAGVLGDDARTELDDVAGHRVGAGYPGSSSNTIPAICCDWLKKTVASTATVTTASTMTTIGYDSGSPDCPSRASAFSPARRSANRPIEGRAQSRSYSGVSTRFGRHSSARHERRSMRDAT